MSSTSPLLACLARGEVVVVVFAVTGDFAGDLTSLGGVGGMTATLGAAALGTGAGSTSVATTAAVLVLATTLAATDGGETAAPFGVLVGLEVTGEGEVLLEGEGGTTTLATVTDCCCFTVLGAGVALVVTDGTEDACCCDVLLTVTGATLT